HRPGRRQAGTGAVQRPRDGHHPARGRRLRRRRAGGGTHRRAHPDARTVTAPPHLPGHPDAPVPPEVTEPPRPPGRPEVAVPPEATAPNATARPDAAAPNAAGWPEATGPRAWYWCEVAWLGDRVAERVLVEVAGDRITAVRRGVPQPDGAVRLAGLTLPGLANGHSHAFHRALRGRTHGERGTFWTWRELMYQVAERLDPDSYYALASAVYAEMALAGVSCVGEFHYLHHGPGGTRYADPNAMGHALLAAAAEAGIRITLLD